MISAANAANAANAAPRSTDYSRPRWPAVLQAQLRAIGRANRAELTVVALLMAGTALLMAGIGLHVSEGIDFGPVELVWPVLLLGVSAPMGVWKGEEPSRRTYFWAMPVDRSRHTLVKVVAGWIWLIVLLGVYHACALAVPLITGGRMAPVLGSDGWMWLIPIVAATAMYLFASIIALTSDHPWRWFAGGALMYVPLMLLREVGAIGLSRLPLARDPNVLERFGFATFTTGTLDGQPNLHAWSTTALLWMAVAVGGVLTSAFRRQER
jgi:hypothetical protein